VSVHLRIEIYMKDDRKWVAFYRTYAEHFAILESDTWTWANSKERATSGYNLFLALKHSTNIVELRIKSSCSGICNYVPPMESSLKLHRLKHLKIRHDGEMNYGVALQQIFQASAGNLENIEFEFSATDQSALKTFLSTMKSIPRQHLRSLKSLSLSEMENDVVALVALELEDLANIGAENLEKLFLGFCLWDEAAGAMQKVLKNFINLKNLTIEGCFVTTQMQNPAITIQVPIMPNLEFLSMGMSFRFPPEFETTAEFPKKRRNSIRVLREAGERLTSFILLDRCCVFISINIVLFNELHFSSFPSLIDFMVHSAWHLTVRFPSLERHSEYPNVTSIQFPHSLTDHTFVEKVIRHFPDIEYCRMTKPSVKVVRAFSKQMLSKIEDDELTLRRLTLELQFDFAASLDWVILDKPSTQLGCIVNDEELKKIEELKAYDHWQEYAQVYGVEVPNVEDLPALENNEEFRGLGALCEQLGEMLDLHIYHKPRTLRIPRGNLKWDHEDCDYTDVIIGFDTKEAPFSDAAWKEVRRSGEIIITGFKVVLISSAYFPNGIFTTTWLEGSQKFKNSFSFQMPPNVPDEEFEGPSAVPVVPQIPTKKKKSFKFEMTSSTIRPKKEDPDWARLAADLGTTNNTQQ